MSIEWGGMRSPEMGMDDSEENEKKRDASFEEIIEAIQNECSHVYDDPENGERLDQLLSDADEFGDVDPKGWQELLKTTKQLLVKAEDDTDAVEAILRKALSKATAELM
jgi:hypothetical protein